MKCVAITLLLSAVSYAAWDCDVDTDPISDETVTLLSTTATSGTNRWGQHPILGIRFTNGDNIEIFILWGTYVGSSDLNCITRIDDAEANSFRLNPSTNNEGTFFRGISDKEELFVEMLDGTEFVCRFTPYSENPITATFSLYGITNAAINGGIDVEAYRQRVAEAEQRQENLIVREGTGGRPGTVYLDDNRGPSVSYRDSTLYVGENIMFQGELHRITEIDYAYHSDRLSKVNLVPLEDYNADHDARGYWATASQLDMYAGDQVQFSQEQESGTYEGEKESSAAEQQSTPYSDLIGSQVLFYDEVHTIIDVEVREGVVRYEIVPGDSTETDFSAEGIIVSPEHVTQIEE